MIVARLSAEDDFDGWREQARALLIHGAKAAEIIWQVGDNPGELFGEQAVTSTKGPPISVPRAFVDLAKKVICHSDARRFSLLYSYLADLLTGQRRMSDAADPLLRQLETMARHVRRDIHKMRAFLRFRRIETGAEELFVAWYEPEHHIVRANARFFVERFANMHWSILTPELSLLWDGKKLAEGPPASRADAPAEDAIEEQWHVYYRSIFNPARLKVGAMLKEMPRKYWRNMPETAHVPDMIAGAQARMAAMIERDVPMAKAHSLQKVCSDARQCRRCPLYADATQMVFGEGPENAAMMIVGEQPGDEEDKAGRPFFGPAGRLLDAALDEAGIDRRQTYVTNAVKHFKYELRGKRRIHQRPNAGEIDHCRWWLKREIELVRPQLIVALGATAIRSLTGRPMSIKDARSAQLISEEGIAILATVHPSFLLRLPDPQARDAERAVFVDDLRRAHDQIRRAA